MANKTRVKGVNTGSGTPSFILYDIVNSNIEGDPGQHSIGYSTEGNQITTPELRIRKIGKNGDNTSLLNSIVPYQKIKLTQENNPGLYQQFHALSFFIDSSVTGEWGYISVAFDVFNVTDFTDGESVIVTII
jgi:hypothetical protein